jgi:hypothetical protein
MFGVGTKGGSASDYATVVDRVVAMTQDRKVQALAHKHKLNVLNVTWEDTGRFKGSAVGPNISDMTIQVESRPTARESSRLSCMPVIRVPNFSDVTGDVPLDTFWLLVGNETGTPLRRVTLREFLSNIRAYLTDATSWPGTRQSLLVDGDTHVLVSAQACFLPIPKAGIAEFNPVLFNYQSRKGDPAVLAILATPEGTSVTVIDNERDGFTSGGTWGQRLFFNDNGERASLTGTRKSDYLKGTADESTAPATNDQPPPKPEDREGLNMVLLIQVPLKQREPDPEVYACVDSMICEFTDTTIDYFMSEVEDAVIGHGAAEGPFTEIDGLEIERDDRFPIRVTVQFYKATADGKVTESDMAEIAQQIDRVYHDADYVGSLVVSGETGRPTEHSGPKVEPPDWWERFWARHFENTGVTREQTIEMLERLLGPSWMHRSERDAERAIGRTRDAEESDSLT